MATADASVYVFRKATKEGAKARIAITGVAGAGKTLTGLIWMTEMCGRGEFGVIDTENNTASKYSDVLPFQTLPLTYYHPEELVKALGAATRAGLPGVMIDTASKFWSGAGGMLEIVDSKRGGNGGNSFGGWKDARPIENQMLEALLAFPGHVVVTMRAKAAYEINTDDRGRKVPVKLGTKPDQREGIEYEFDFVVDMDLDGPTGTVSKSRCQSLTGKIMTKPGPEFARDVLSWLSEGVTGVSANEYRDRALEPGITFAELGALMQEVRSAGKEFVMVMDGHGDVVPLGALIISRGNELKAAEAPADAASKPKAA